jgi:predicted CxxxxCH...CXXCH cytochrome family protein
VRRKTWGKLIGCQLLSVVLCLPFINANATEDWPHNANSGIGCRSCHDLASSEPKLLPPLTHTSQDLDDTTANGLCWSCHTGGTLPPNSPHYLTQAPYVKTHSSLNTSNKYGNWTVECSVCHNQHLQDQIKTYGAASYAYNGTITGVNATTITVATAIWSVDQYAGYVVVPNTAQVNYNYKIISNTATTLTVKGPIDLTYAAVDNTLGISYSKLIRSNINLAEIKGVTKSGVKAVKFFNSTGTNSFADGDGNVDGICEVCHDQTNHFRNDGSRSGIGPHVGLTGANCTGCHSHSTGFKAGCNGCHAYPPATNAHNVHVGVLKYECSECHFNNNHNSTNISTSPTHFLADYNRSLVDVAFDPAGFNTAAIVGGLGAPLYVRNATPGQVTCANLTCHNPDNKFTGKGVDNNYRSNNIPLWSSTIITCQNCHYDGESDNDGGSHDGHNGNFRGSATCVECHSEVNVIDPETKGTDSRHANKILNIDQADNDNYPIHVKATRSNTVITAVYKDGPLGTKKGGTCSGVYCHGEGLLSETGWAKNKDWGGMGWWGNCNGCHYDSSGFAYSNNKSHVIHTNYGAAGSYSYGPIAQCSECHDTSYSGHNNGKVDLLNSSDGTLANTRICDNCHGTAEGIAEAKANWNLNTTNDRHRISSCMYCHNGSTPANSKADKTGKYASAKDSFVTTGHGATSTFNATGNQGPSFVCTTCHDKNSQHIDKNGQSGIYTRLFPITDDGIAYTSEASQFCLDCHKLGQTANGVLGYDAKSEASIHSGAINNKYNTAASSVFPAYGDKARYATLPGYQCSACHDAHGTSKLAMIKETIDGKIGGNGNPVPVTGFEASDTDFRDMYDSSTDTDRVCSTCHSLLGGSPHPDTSHPGNNHHLNQAAGCAKCHAPHGQLTSSKACMECHNHKFSFANVGISSKIADQTLDFGSVAATAASFKTVTVKNYSSTPVTIGTMGLPVDYTQTFSQTFTQDLCSGQTLAPAATCTFGVRFQPPAIGAYNGTFIIPSNDSASPATVILKGTGTAAGPDITVSSISIRFNDSQVSTTYSQTITIINEGSSDLTSVTIDSAVPHLSAPFSIANNTCTPDKVLRPTTPSLNDSCTFDVLFTPTAKGIVSSSFKISSNDPDENPVVVTVDGTGIIPVYAYVSNGGTIIYKVNTFDKSVTDMTNITDSQSRSIAVKPDGSRFYVPAPTSFSPSVSLPSIPINPTGEYIRGYDPVTGYISSTFSGSYPSIVAISPNGAYLYFLANQWRQTGGSGSPIRYTNEYFLKIASTLNNTITKSIQITSVPERITVSPDSSEVYLSNKSYNTIDVYRTSSLQKSGTLSLAQPSGLAFSPDSSKAYVAITGNVAIIRTSDKTLIKNISIPEQPIDIVVSPDGAYVYTANTAGTYGAVSVIRTSDDIVINTIPLSLPYNGRVSNISITPDGNQLFINTNSGVKVISTATNTVTDTIAAITAASSYGDCIAARDPNVTSPNITITDSYSYNDDHFIDFGIQTINRASTAQTITVKNDGTANLIIGNLATANQSAQPFSIVSGNDNCSAKTLAAAASCTVQVKFTPFVKGTFTYKFLIPSNDPVENPTAVTLSGTANEPDITVTDDVSPANDLLMPFGNRVQGTKETRTITVKNDGAGYLEFSGITTTAPFSIQAGSTCLTYMTPSSSFWPNGTCQILVDFTPPALSPYNSTVNIQSNDPDKSLVTVAVSGQGTIAGPDISLIDIFTTTSPAITSLDFGYVEINAPPVYKDLWARNDGTANLTTGSFPLPAVPFTVNPDGLSNQSLAVGAITNYLRVYFDPISPGTFTAQLSIPTNDPDPDENPAKMSLTGIGYEKMAAFITNTYQIKPITITYAVDGSVTNTETSFNPYYYSLPFGVSATPSITYVTSVLSFYSSPNTAEYTPAPPKNHLLFLETSTRKRLATVAVGNNPKGVAAAPNGNNIYVANFDDNTVSVVSRATQTVVATVPTDRGPTGVDVTPNNNYVYVTNFTDNTVSVIRTTDNSVIKTIFVGTNPNGIAVSPNGAYVYVTNYGDNTVSVIQTSDNTVVATINVGTNPFGIAITPDGSRAYVTNYTDGSVSVIQTSDNSVIKTITGIIRPKGIASTPDSRLIYVVTNDTASTNGFVHVIQTVDNTEITIAKISESNTAFGKFITAIGSGVDGDGVADTEDNCPTVYNPFQIDTDGDGKGDGCDPCPTDIDNDSDGDGICNGATFLAPKTGIHDNCPTVSNANQANIDGDGIGDACDVCPDDPNNDSDGDGICVGARFNGPKIGGNDNCVTTPNTDQLDSDCNGVGDACNTPAYSYTPPASLNVSIQQFLANSTVSWIDAFNGENGYRIERQDGVCGVDNTNPFVGLATIYQLDDFATGVDLTGWLPGAQVATASNQGVMPASVSDTTGSSSVTWLNGAVKLHTVTNGTGTAGYNYTSLAPKNFAGIIGDKDFDIQYDFSLPNGIITPTPTKYFSYVRMDMYMPTTNSKTNDMFVARMRDGFVFSATVNGVNQSATFATTATSGTFRMVRNNRQLSGYYWDGTDWKLLLKHSQPLTADLTPTWTGFAQHGNRTEPTGQDITTIVDNFRFNTVGGLPVAALKMNLDESSWTATPGVVHDSAADSNHGTAFGGTTTTTDPERGVVGQFDGVDDYVEISGAGILQNVTDASFTFAAWAKPMAVPAGVDLVNWMDTRASFMSRPGQHTCLSYLPNKQFHFSMFSDASTQIKVPSFDSYEPNQWHHVVGVVDAAGKTVSLYVDGQLKNSKPYTGIQLDYGTNSYYLGTASTSVTSFRWPFNGMVDDARIFDRALSATEVATLYGKKMQFTDSGLTAGTNYCYRVYPLKTDSCPNWQNQAAQISYTTPSNALPAQPINLIPADGATDVYALLPTLTASPFSDPDAGDTHYASQWQISTVSGGTAIYNSGTVAPATSHTVTTALTANTTYYWRVRYQDNKGEWSPYSSDTSFVITNAAPSQPINATPAAGDTNISILPTLTASVFTDSNAGDTHQASQWLISTGSGAAFDAGIVYNSGTAAGSTSHTITSSLTLFSTVHYWKVRYQDSRGDWSSYSNETSFTTISNVPPNQPVNSKPANGATGVERKPVLTASAFVDPGDTHQASQWQIKNASVNVYDSGTVAGSTSHTVTTALAGSTLYYWKVRYQDSNGVWSNYSTETTFTTNNLISEWHLDEGSGATAADSFGSNTGTIRNGAVWDGTTAFLGKALIFNGSNNDVIWTYSAGIPANNFTLEAMVKATTIHEIDAESTISTAGTSGQRYLFGANQSGSDGGAGVSVGTNGISVYEHGGGYMPPLAVYSGSLGTVWNHIVVTYTNKQPRIYLNGVLARTGLTSPKTNIYAPTAIGGGAYGFFPGTIDEVRIYGNALSDAEILQRCKDLGKCAP